MSALTRVRHTHYFEHLCPKSCITVPMAVYCEGGITAYLVMGWIQGSGSSKDVVSAPPTCPPLLVLSVSRFSHGKVRSVHSWNCTVRVPEPLPD